MISHENRTSTIVAALLLVSAVVLVYAKTAGFAFVQLDDYEYIVYNDAVKAGLTAGGVRWAVTSSYMANWHPLTWLSHMADVSLFGVAPGPQHLMNALLHALSTAVLFLALKRMTGAVWRSAFVAALFGIHPLHVESVAWIAERKDVLSGFFFMLVLLFYERYARRGGTARYLLVMLFLSLGLLSKPMLVTTPFVLLLLDFWPLGRTKWAEPAEGAPWTPLSPVRLVLEKVPLFCLAAASSSVTYIAQQRGGAMTALSLLPLSERLANAVVANASYVEKAVWPASLSFFYVYPDKGHPWWLVVLSLCLIAGLSVLSLLFMRKKPFLLSGWLWYVGMLVPVIGFVQVGAQAMADRYSYLPLTGLFVMVVWSAADMVSALQETQRKLAAAISGAILVILGAVTSLQISYWADPMKVYQHAIRLDKGNWFAHNNLGLRLAGQGRYDLAIKEYGEATKLRPDYLEAHNNMAIALAQTGRIDEALFRFATIVQAAPYRPDFRLNLAHAQAAKGLRDEASRNYQEVLRLDPGNPQAIAGLRRVSEGGGKREN